MPKTSPMPIVTLPDTLTGREREIAERCLNKGRLRATKPPTDGEAQYVWRMAAFVVSPHWKHHTLPIGAQFALPRELFLGGLTPNTPGWVADMNARAARRKARLDELDAVVDAIVDSVPRTQWHGGQRWHNAFYGA
jgi:hypothetical protein